MFARGKIELLSKSLRRNLSSGDHLCNRFTTEDDHDSGEAGQCDSDLRRGAESFARFYNFRRLYETSTAFRSLFWIMSGKKAETR
jgi:hypothetical protein